MKKLYIFFLFIFLSANVTTETKQLNFLYTNDLHAHLQPHIEQWISKTRPVGGFANLATLIKEEKSANPNTLYIDAGDYFSGPYISTLTEGEAVIDTMNLLGVDAACIGNHEFDHGWESMLSKLEMATFPIVNGNIFYEGTDELIWDNPYVILENNGLKIGVIGLHGKFAFYDTTNFKMVDGLEARDEEYYLRKYIKELEPITDLIVLSVHEGVPGRQSTKGLSDVERTLSKDIDLAKNVPGVDIMITGHAHKGTPEALLSNETIIVSTNAYSIELGKLVISYDTEKNKIVDYSNELITIFDDEIEDDPEMSKVIDYWESQVQKIALKEVSFTTEKMVRAYGEESNMGNLFADAVEEYDQKVDFAVINSGALRQDLDPGVLTKGDLISAFPFPNTLVMTKITGAQIEGLFNHAAGMTNGVLQVSKSFKYVIDSNSEIKELRLNGKPIEREKTYWVASTNFVTLGGDGYWEFTESIEYEDTNIFIVDVVEDYLKDKPRYSPVYEERIVIE